ncbi:DgyrCDS12092 [Dimorphilus gyrociliatus]|uniref:DgyrCDS12092 n=1 Tax=Dimorphilus gyrociliatus TaxID=2664684 RepID=A0A7I8W7A6_9ANNE|nr:DgyrCDS12092 [Dimorphilus gyrociliatus]
MPHVNGGGGDDLASTDEVKVYKDEGEDETRENLSEDKLGLVTETEEEKNADIGGNYEGKSQNASSDGSKNDAAINERLFGIAGFPLVTPYPPGYPPGLRQHLALSSTALSTRHTTPCRKADELTAAGNVGVTKGLSKAD